MEKREEPNIADLELVHERQSRLAAIIDSSDDAIISKDLSGIILTWNQGAERLFGYAAKEVIGESINLLVPQDRLSEESNILACIRKGERIDHVETVRLRKDGRPVDVSVTASPLRNMQGEIIGASKIARDISERKQAEETQRKSYAMAIDSAELLKAIFDNAVDAIITINERGIIQNCNLSTEKILGYTAKEVIGQNVKMLMPSPYHEEHDGYLDRYAETGEKKIIGIGRQVSARKKDGTIFPISLAVSEVKFEGGRLFAGMIRDISEAEKAKAELEHRSQELARSNSELEQFAYVASHDLQEPLRMIGSFTELLARRYQGKLDKDADEFIAYIVDATKRMRSLVGDLLLLSRVGSQGKETEPTDANAVIDQLLCDISHSIQETCATITRDPLPTVLADRRQLSQIFQNLISNALKFKSKDPPKVHISFKKSDKDWIFSVSDNGIGIDPQYFERVFVIFQRLQGREDYPGTGIGLAICKKIVERHHGKIWIESEQCKGSTFYFSIPVKPRKGN
jgi:PAS domain S-box-containing protein